MKIIAGDIEIFEILEEAGLDTFAPTEPRVLEFVSGEYWHLFLFSPSGRFKGCKLFLIDKALLHAELENQLLPAILSLPDDDEYEMVKNEALSTLEKMIGSGVGQARFFDAH